MKRVTIDYANSQTDEDQPLKLNPKRYEEGDDDDDDDDEVSDDDTAMNSASAAGIYKSKPKSSSDLKAQRTGTGIEEDEDVNEDNSESDDDDDEDYEESGDNDDNGSNYSSSYENDEAEEADTGKDKEGDGEGEGDEEDEADSTGDLQNDEDEDHDSENGEDDDRYRKINQEFRKNYIAETHPEAKSHTDDEIHALAKVVRDKTGTIVDPLHRTIPVLTKYEKTRILGIRTKQLNNGAEPYITSKVNITSEKVIDGYPIALRELEEKKLPFIIRRPLPGGGMEYWYLQDLEIL
jgi:DNA-directed RNA polymerase I, II, and III subunit RPABC2